MSHIHNICGGPNAASDYQDYLARLSAARLARKLSDTGPSAEPRTFDSAIDADPDSEHDQGNSPGDQGDNPEEGDPEAKDSGSAEEDGEGGPTWLAKA